jgi:MoxR-like ATPase
MKARIEPSLLQGYNGASLPSAFTSTFTYRTPTLVMVDNVSRAARTTAAVLLTAMGDVVWQRTSNK